MSELTEQARANAEDGDFEAARTLAAIAAAEALERIAQTSADSYVLAYEAINPGSLT